MRTLFEIATEHAAQAEALQSLDIDPQTLADTLDSISGELDAKLHAVMTVALTLESTATACTERSDALRARAKSAAERADYLRKYAAACIRLAGRKFVDCGDFVASAPAQSKRVVIDDHGALPPDLWRTVPAHSEPDAAEIRRRLLAGGAVPGARLELHDTAARIK